MPRAFLIVIDSLGCGGARDAALFGDAGANTIGHVASACASGSANRGGRRGPLRTPCLDSLGLGVAAELSTGAPPPGFGNVLRPGAATGFACEVSSGKDTPSGHWEMAGAPLKGSFGLFPKQQPAFDPRLIAEIVAESGIAGVIGQRHAAGVAIIDELGAEHVATGKPIVYTSVDSVIQIAAHEETFGLENLYRLCEITRRHVDALNIGRVIARPFAGSSAEGFSRTPRRRDFAMPAPDGNILDRAHDAGRAIITVGKIGDIFGHRNTGEEIKGESDVDLLDRMLAAADSLPDGGLLFANLVDLDTDYGHRRDVAGYAAGLERLDPLIERFVSRLAAGDLCVITADHGTDPTWSGTDHTRENVPVLSYEPEGVRREIGERSTFADVGASVAKHLGLRLPASGTPWN
ncbi:MAG: phosphopentomutase [Beijerinckiaceae bacterium]